MSDPDYNTKDQNACKLSKIHGYTVFELACKPDPELGFEQDDRHVVNLRSTCHYREPRRVPQQIHFWPEFDL